jgi:hypothetical protein
MTTSIEVGSPVDVCIEASLDAIIEGDLNTFEGEQYDTLRNVISIIVDNDGVTFETCRSIEAWKRGEPNAGRGTLTIDKRLLQCVYIDDKPVWGRPGQ